MFTPILASASSKTWANTPLLKLALSSFSSLLKNSLLFLPCAADVLKPDNGNHQMEPKSTSIFFHHNMGEMKCPSSCHSFQRHPGSHPLLPKNIFTPSVLFSSPAATISSSFSAVQPLWLLPHPLLLSKTKFLGGNIYTSYHHLVTSHSPLIHFILASETTALVLLPRALLPLRQIHGTLAYLRPTQLFTALGAADHFLIL